MEQQYMIYELYDFQLIEELLWRQYYVHFYELFTDTNMPVAATLQTPSYLIFTIFSYLYSINVFLSCTFYDIYLLLSPYSLKLTRFPEV